MSRSPKAMLAAVAKAMKPQTATRQEREARRLEREARSMITTALLDLNRGDRLDAIDALNFAVKKLHQSRAASMGSMGMPMEVPPA